jgi:porin
MDHRFVAAALLCARGHPASAYDVTDRFSIGAVLGTAGQCQEGLGAPRTTLLRRPI